MGLVDGLPVGLGVVTARNNELALVRAMAAIEQALGLGILTPTFTK
jgi:Asp-tRNA(Asn)/Glu-tRNA(Gln) amidotransferase A subunit family amidase